MDVGLLVLFQNYLGRGSDEDVVKGEMRLADIAEPLGYDKIWSAEHHFTDYSAIPDNVQYLSSRTVHSRTTAGPSRRSTGVRRPASCVAT
jgi:hypothetical protein